MKAVRIDHSSFAQSLNLSSLKPRPHLVPPPVPEPPPLAARRQVLGHWLRATLGGIGCIALAIWRAPAETPVQRAIAKEMERGQRL